MIPMFQKKALLPALCVSICLCAGMIPNVSAVENVNSTIVTPCSMYITDAKVRFAIDKGIATIKASVIGQDGVDRCKVEVTLQEKVGSTWKIVGTWTDETGGVRASVSETKEVTAGKTYRAKVVVTAWSGSKSETKTILSPEKKA